MSSASEIKVLMNGVDTMCKAELVTLCEKYAIPNPGKSVKDLRYTLKKWYEVNGVPDVEKKAAPAPAPAPAPVAPTPAPAVPALPPKCTAGAMCPDLYSYKHRQEFLHDGFRPNPIKCRDGMGCPKLKDREHLVKYAHEDALDRICKDGAACQFLHVMSHRLAFEHLGFRAQPVACRDGANCSLLSDRGHLFKYAHDIPMPGTAPSAAVSAPTPTPPATPAPVAATAPATPAAVVAPAVPASSGLAASASGNSVASPTAPAPGANGNGNGNGAGNGVKTVVVDGKSMADFPLESAPESVLERIQNDSEEFWDLEEKFAANLQGNNEDYVANRIKAGKKPLRFLLVGAERVVNPVLEARFELKKRELMATRDAKEWRERVSFHGTHPKNLKSILRYSLLRFKHPLNPCKTQVDDGYFGTNKKGIYVSRYADYTLKYSNRVCAVDAGDKVKTIMFRTLPGRSKHIEKLVGAIDPTPGFDSHSSPTFLEWYLFDEAQVCPAYVLEIKAVEDTRTAADDQ